jgi:hypothetical protein
MLLTSIFFALMIGHPPPNDTTPWAWKSQDGHRYLMPPVECRVGPLPKYDIVYLSQAEMDHRFLEPGSRYSHKLGNERLYPDGRVTIFLSNELTPAVHHDLLIHEQAHARGCQHVGF